MERLPDQVGLKTCLADGFTTLGKFSGIGTCSCLIYFFFFQRKLSLTHGIPSEKAQSSSSMQRDGVTKDSNEVVADSASHKFHLMYFISLDGRTVMTARALNEISLSVPRAALRFFISLRLQTGASDFRWNFLDTSFPSSALVVCLKE